MQVHQYADGHLFVGLGAPDDDHGRHCFPSILGRSPHGHRNAGDDTARLTNFSLALELTGQSAFYQWMNVVGAAGFTVNGWWHGALPSAALNVIWMLIGAVALLRIAAARRKTDAGTPQAMALENTEKSRA